MQALSCAPYTVPPYALLLISSLFTHSIAECFALATIGITFQLRDEIYCSGDTQKFLEHPSEETTVASTALSADNDLACKVTRGACPPCGKSDQSTSGSSRDEQGEPIKESEKKRAGQTVLIVRSFTVAVPNNTPTSTSRPIQLSVVSTVSFQKLRKHGRLVEPHSFETSVKRLPTKICLGQSRRQPPFSADTDMRLVLLPESVSMDKRSSMG